YLAKHSPAIDSGDSWNAPRSDIDGRPTPLNDPATTPNTGSPEYFPASNSGNLFTATGTAQNFHTNGSYFIVNLPFTFNFYGVNYTSVIVGNTGLIRLGTVPDVLLYDGLNSFFKFASST